MTTAQPSTPDLWDDGDGVGLGEVGAAGGLAAAASAAGSPTDSILHGYAWSRAGGVHKLEDLGAIEAALRDPAARVWVDCENPSASALERLGRAFRLHPLTVEDIAERNQRAKVEYSSTRCTS
jgi:Mg2+ and Co2+ transporter CorA